LDEYAEEFPDRAEERRKMLARLAESAEDGVLSPDLDGVIHTLFYDLLRRGLKPSKQFWKRENSTPKPRKASKQKASAAPAGTTSIWKKEISLGRSSQPKQKAAAAGGDKTPWWKKEVSLGRSSEPKEEVVVPVERDAVEEKTPFLKKELSLGRSSEPEEEVSALVE